VVGQPLENLVVPPDRLAESNWVTEALTKGQRITLETQRRKKDGTLLDVSVSCAPLLLDGKMAGFYAGLSRHFRSQARRSFELGALPGRPRSPAARMICISSSPRFNSIVAELMYARIFTLPYMIQLLSCFLSLISLMSTIRHLLRRNWAKD